MISTYEGYIPDLNILILVMNINTRSYISISFSWSYWTINHHVTYYMSDLNEVWIRTNVVSSQHRTTNVDRPVYSIEPTIWSVPYCIEHSNPDPATSAVASLRGSKRGQLSPHPSQKLFLRFAQIRWDLFLRGGVPPGSRSSCRWSIVLFCKT